LPLPITDALGDWECKEHGSKFMVMPGVYWFPEEEGTSKTRGVSKKVLERYRSKIKAAWDHLDGQRLNEILISGALPETAHRAPYPYTYISSPTFIGIRQALAWEQASDADPNATLRYAGVWQLECEDEHCSHEKCGKRRVSFDWSSKRYGGKLIEWQDGHGETQRYVEHRPVLGARSAMSTPSQPKLLTLFEEHKRLGITRPLSSHLAMTAGLWRGLAEQLAQWFYQCLSTERVPALKLAVVDIATDAKRRAVRWRLGNSMQRPIPTNMASQAPDLTVEFAQKIYSENVLDHRHDVWDVHTNVDRWWVITNPTNLYSQAQFPNMDLAVTFHIGLCLRMPRSEKTKLAELWVRPLHWSRWCDSEVT
jgi:hypothetical protein